MSGLPKFLDDAFENANEIMNAMTTKGQKNLDIYEDKIDKFQLTSFGILLDMKNSKGDGFSVLVMDNNDADIFRKRIVDASDGIRENFPNVCSSH